VQWRGTFFTHTRVLPALEAPPGVAAAMAQEQPAAVAIARGASALWRKFWQRKLLR
jgi:hypothetical protein